MNTIPVRVGTTMSPLPMNTKQEIKLRREAPPELSITQGAFHVSGYEHLATTAHHDLQDFNSSKPGVHLNI
jgi:hypothetical protein